MKKSLLQFIQNLAASVFIGIAVYGAIICYGGETQKRIPVKESLFLGLGAVICIIVVVGIGGLQDKLARKLEDEDQSESEGHG